MKPKIRIPKKNQGTLIPLTKVGYFRLTLTLLGVMLLLTGCTPPKNPKESILYVTVSLGNPFYQEMIQGIRSELGSANENQIECRAGAKTDDATGQRDIMESFLSQHEKGQIRLRGLILVPANTGIALTETIRRYNAAKVPVINLDIPIDEAALSQAGASVSTFIGSSNLLGGMLAGEVMAKKLPTNSHILLLNGANGSANARDRRDGFVNRITELGNSRHVTYQFTEWTANWNKSEAIAGTDSILAGGAIIHGIFAANDLMALGAAEAVEATQLGSRPKPIIVGYDAQPEALKAVREGRMYDSISQNPGAMGRKAVECLRRLEKGETVPKREVIPVASQTH